MVITRSIPVDEFVRRVMRDKNITEPAGRPKAEDLQKQNREFADYKMSRETAIMKEHMRKLRRSRKLGASQ